MRRSLSSLEFARSHSRAGRAPVAPPVDRLAALKERNTAQYNLFYASAIAKGDTPENAARYASRYVLGPRY